MAICTELTTSCESRKNIGFPTAAISINEIKNAGLKHKEATIDPSIITIWFLLKLTNRVSLHMKRAIASRWLHSCQCGLHSLTLVVSY